MTMSCSIKMPPNDDKECDKDEFNKTSCGYVTLANKVYRCAEVEKNFTYHEKEHLKPVKQCDDVCPASGSGWSSLTRTKIVLNHSFYNWEMLPSIASAVLLSPTDISVKDQQTLIITILKL